MAQALMGMVLGVGTAIAGLLLSLAATIAMSIGERRGGAILLLTMAVLALAYGSWLARSMGG